MQVEEGREAVDEEGRDERRTSKVTRRKERKGKVKIKKEERDEARMENWR